MAKRTLGAARFSLIGLALITISPTSFSATPAQAPPPSAFDRGDARNNVSPAGMPALLNQGLANPALKLTRVQMGQIDGIVAAYVNEEKALRQRYKTSPGTEPSTEAEAASRQARTNLTAAVHRILDSSQRKVWDASLAKRGLTPAGLPAITKPDENKSPPAR